MRNNWIDLLHLLRFIVARFTQDRYAQMAASLTFTTLLSLVPLIAIALTLFSAFPVFDDYSINIKKFLLANMLPETGGMIISRYVQQFAESAAKLTAVGIVFLALTAMLMMQTIDNAFNMIWRVARPRPVVQRVLIYWAVLTLAPLLVGASLSLTSWLAGISMGYSKQIPGIGIMMLQVVPVLLTTLAFSLMFRVVPNRFVPLKHALLGGVVAALAFALMNYGFTYYIAHFPTYTLVYGAFASIPIFLLWIYLSWLTILFGALIASSTSHWRCSAAIKINAAAKLYYALGIIKAMSVGTRSGDILTTQAFSTKLRIGFDSLEQILEDLVQINVVCKLTDKGWALIRDDQHILASELYRLFVFNLPSIPATGEDEEIQRWLMQLQQRISETTSLTLNQLFAAKKPPAE